MFHRGSALMKVTCTVADTSRKRIITSEGSLTIFAVLACVRILKTNCQTLEKRTNGTILAMEKQTKMLTRKIDSVLDDFYDKIIFRGAQSAKEILLRLRSLFLPIA